MATTILAIESSCDDTGAAVIRDGKILSNIVAGQKLHEKYGGVVPELASREHLQNIVPVVDEALNKAGVKKEELNAIAVTIGPGLIGSLMVGVSFAKAMALALDVPFITVNHMQAHVMANFIDEPVPAFPFLCLTVSGGHTQIVLVNSITDMKLVGESLDDAAGEAFDKTAKLLGLPYPGGPLIDKLAQTGNGTKFKFPEGRVEGLDFSFSGFKTSVMYFLRDHLKADADFVKKNLNDICASIQTTIVSVLLKKMIKASDQYGCLQIAIAGGVSANSGLRQVFEKAAVKYNWSLFVPKLEYCTDNAAMIAIAAHYKFIANDFASLGVEPTARLNINN